MGNYTANGTWLSHAYVTTASFIDANTPTLLQKMSESYDVDTLYVNVGAITSSGRLQSGTYPQVVRFLDAVHAYEVAHGVTFKVFAALSGNLDPAVPEYIEIGTGPGNDRAMIIDEAKRFCSTTISGSYLVGADRAFDGVMIDFEPSGPRDEAMDDTNFNNLKTLMQDMRNAFNAAGLGSRQLGVAAHRYGDGSRWKWPTRYFYYMAKYVNVLAVMTYNSGSTSGPAYQSWMQSNATSALRAVSGEAYSDGNHPPPTNNPRVYFGFAAYPANSVHDPAFENTKYGAWGLDAAITALVNDPSDDSENYMAGAYMYLHADGDSAPETYARWDTDWYWFYEHWLGK
ncbi:MAG: hypothetical protein IRZ16_03160 [Myxococcaceae bacterium]|nr:hypothetical protein [Myxococcaceae bacterium]